jgi:hypothetical protein
MWPSLAQQVVLAGELFGERGDAAISTWLDRETARIDDPAFARGFSDHIDLPGIAPADYNHRCVRSRHGDLLGGIRFFGRDIGRPFVEVIAHGFADLDALRACVASEWSEFGPRFLRLHVEPRTLTGPDVLLDHTIHAARFREMSPPCSNVELAPFESVDEAVALVAAGYDAVSDPHLRRDVRPAGVDDLSDLHRAGLLRAGRVDGAVVGVLAVSPGTVTWLEGDEIIEEVVAARFAGRGYAAAMQATWARSVARDRDRMLIGTIDYRNHASRKTAERAGRPCVLDAVFVPLTRRPHRRS